MYKASSSEILKNKVYKNRAIYLATFLGGPLVAGYMISENFKVFGNKEKVYPTWIICILFTIAIFTIAFFIPDDSRVPNAIIPLIYSTITYLLVQHIQGRDILEHSKQGGTFFGWGRAILVSLIGLSVTLLILFTVVFSIDMVTDNTTSKTYGEIENEIVYDPNNISGYEVDVLATKLKKISFFDDESSKSIYVDKKGLSYELYISVINKEIIKDLDVERDLRFTRVDLQSLYPDNKIVFNIVVDDIYDVIKRIE